ncbi:peptidase S8 family [Rhizoctonia solani]|uniref:Peptidase S8 family n=1 Tax=Rhizoctonia solani TaxID=456999 RepID=A0A8H7MAC9_9AGAM|nr:peptidase S8 family [Rhizoctonia solani]
MLGLVSLHRVRRTGRWSSSHHQTRRTRQSQLLHRVKCLLPSPDSPVIDPSPSPPPNRKLKDGVSKSAHLKTLLSGSKVAYTYGPAFQGYAAQLDDQALDYVRKSKDVESIFQDVQVQLEEISTSEGQVAARGMGYESSPLVKRLNGTGVDIYQIDTGIYTAHTQFGGRAKWGATFGGYPNADGNGHGTAQASIIVGSTYGVATRANITAIKGESIKINHGASITHMIDLAPQAFGDDGSANLSDIISGINWVITNSGPAATRKAIISITVTISGYQPFDNAVTNALNAGIHVVVPAGDQNVDASTISPARVAAAVTVGAVAANGSKLATSNFGSVVDVWGPGRNVPVAWISSPSAAVTLVGTTASAASNVAGILAVAIDNHGNKSPAALQADLKSNAQTVNGFLIPKVW